MKHIEVLLSDSTVEDLTKISPEDFRNFIERMERLHIFQEQQKKAGYRWFIAKFLLGAATVILTVSLGLIVAQAFGWANLPEAAITTLIGSVAVEFVGMLWMVVRYLFKKDVRDDNE